MPTVLSIFALHSCIRQARAKFDEPPSRVKPLSLSLLTQTVTLALQEKTALASASAECLVFAYYFLLRPGEYLG